MTGGDFIERLPDAALLLSSEGTILKANEHAGRALLRRVDILQGGSLSELYKLASSERKTAQLEPSSEAEVQTLHLRGPDDEDLFFDVTISQFEENGSLLSLVLLRRQKERSADEIDAHRRSQAVETWNVGLYEHEHLTDNIYGSSQVRELYGLAADEELSIEVFMKALHPDDQEIAISAIMKAHNPEGDGNFDAFHRIRRGDGSIRWIHTRAKTHFGLVNGQRVPVLTTGSIMNMTEHQELKLALQKNEERLTQAMVASEVGIFEVNHRPEEGESVAFWSKTLREILGMKPDAEADLEWFLSRVHPDDRRQVAAGFTESMDPKKRARYEIEHRFVSADGRNLWLSARATTSFEEEGPVPVALRTTGAIVDITERKVAEEDRRRRTAILDATPDFVSMTNTEGDLVFLNLAGRRLLGIKPDEELEGWNMAQAHPAEELERIRSLGLSVARKLGSWTAETRFTRHDGAIVPMSQVLLVHRDSSGRESFFSTIARDLSRERELEAQFRQAQKMDAVGRLAGGVAHDFNNLLSVIMGFAELAGNRAEKGRSANSEIQEIQRAAGRAAALTGQLLAFSRKQILSPRAIDVNEIVLETVPMLERLLGEHIDLSVSTSMRPARTKADPNQLEQILVNLIVNARDAMPKGGELKVTVGESLLTETQDLARLDLGAGRFVVISVTDSGHGMNAGTREKIFEPFFTTKEQGRGTGLGLSTVFGIVRQSGGAIDVESQPDEGATFRVYLPSTDEVPQIRPSQRPEESEPASGVILVTEDEEQLRTLLVRVLSQEGYRVIGASDPTEALEMAAQEPGVIDLLLTDVVMPKMSGKDLADRLLERRPSTKVIYMSGYTDDSIVHHGVLDESVNFIAKPITPQALLARIARVLRGEAGVQ